MPNASSIPGIYQALAPFIGARQALNNYRASILPLLQHVNDPGLDPSIVSQIQDYAADYTSGEDRLSWVEDQIRNALADAGFTYDIGLGVAPLAIIAVIAGILAAAGVAAWAIYWNQQAAKTQNLAQMILAAIRSGTLTPEQGQNLLAEATGGKGGGSTPGWLVPVAAVGAILLVVFMMTR